MKLLIPLLLAAMLGGCATVDTAQLAVRDYGARAADDARESAEWALCHGITVGAWRRAYAADPQRAQGWMLLCTQPAVAPLAPLPAPDQPRART